MAGTTRLELATSAVTGQRSNQLNYVPTRQINGMRLAQKYPNSFPQNTKERVFQFPMMDNSGLCIRDRNLIFVHGIFPQ